MGDQQLAHVMLSDVGGVICSFLDSKSILRIAVTAKALKPLLEDRIPWAQALARDFGENYNGHMTQYECWRLMVQSYGISWPLAGRARAAVEGLRHWMRHHLPDAAEDMHHGASPRQLDEAEAALGVRFPLSVRALYATMNGQGSKAFRPSLAEVRRTFLHGAFGGVHVYDILTSKRLLPLPAVVEGTLVLRANRSLPPSFVLLTFTHVNPSGGMAVDCDTGNVFALSASRLQFFRAAPADPAYPQPAVAVFSAPPAAPPAATAATAATGPVPSGTPLLEWLEEHVRRLYAGIHGVSERPGYGPGASDLSTQFLSLWPRPAPLRVPFHHWQTTTTNTSSSSRSGSNSGGSSGSSNGGGSGATSSSLPFSSSSTGTLSAAAAASIAALLSVPPRSDPDALGVSSHTATAPTTSTSSTSSHTTSSSTGTGVHVAVGSYFIPEVSQVPPRRIPQLLHRLRLQAAAAAAAADTAAASTSTGGGAGGADGSGDSVMVDAASNAAASNAAASNAAASNAAASNAAASNARSGPGAFITAAEAAAAEEDEDCMRCSYRIWMWLDSEGEQAAGGAARPLAECQLQSRRWRICDAANGSMQEVEGPGVIGEYPHLLAGVATPTTSGSSASASVRPGSGRGVYSYASLTGTGWAGGSMGGSFQMVPGTLAQPRGAPFDAVVGEWKLVLPDFIY